MRRAATWAIVATLLVGCGGGAGGSLFTASASAETDAGRIVQPDPGQPVSGGAPTAVAGDEAGKAGTGGSSGAGVQPAASGGAKDVVMGSADAGPLVVSTGGASAVFGSGSPDSGTPTSSAGAAATGTGCAEDAGLMWTVYTVDPGHCLDAGSSTWVGPFICNDRTPDDGVCDSECSDYLNVKVPLAGNAVRIAVLVTQGTVREGTFIDGDPNYAGWCYTQLSGIGN
jgi:hypothetical protein